MRHLPPRKVLMNPELKRKGIYIVPNALTTAALFAGFLGVIEAMRGHFESAAIAVFVAIIFDGLDGRVARLTHTQSAFGAEYDSLSDMVCFGVAPALIAFEWVLQDLGRWGWIAAFFYCACAALRLARFNTSTEVIDKRFFQGLPSPAAAALVAGFVWLMIDLNISLHAISWWCLLLTLFVGAAMISNAPYYSFKGINLRKSVPFIFLAMLLLFFVLVSSYPPGILFALFLLYALSAPLLTGWFSLKKKRQEFPSRPVSTPAPAFESPDRAESTEYEKSEYLASVSAHTTSSSDTTPSSSSAS